MKDLLRMESFGHEHGCLCDRCKLCLLFVAVRVKARELKPEQTADKGVVVAFESEAGLDVGFVEWAELEQGMGFPPGFRRFLTTLLDFQPKGLCWLARLKSGALALGDMHGDVRAVNFEDVQATPARANLSTTEREVLDYIGDEMFERGQIPDVLDIVERTELDEPTGRRALMLLEGRGLVRRAAR